MGRITKIEGKFMGVPFEVKPTPIKFDSIVEQRRQMLLDWYKENHPDTFEKLDNEEMDLEDYTQEDIDNLNAWIEDVEFRVKYLKFTANACMDLKKEISEDTWKSDSLEMSTIEEAWDFFTGRQKVPTGGLQVR